jgi:transcriptional regulator with XRE-family HTH domain/Tfp pilus assembly protein PilF
METGRRRTPANRLDVAAVGRRVAQLRRSRGWTQQQLAAELPLSVSYVSLIEAGKRTPSAKVLERLSAVLDCSVEHLRTGAWPPDPQALELEFDFAELAFRSGDAATARCRYLELLRQAREGHAPDKVARALFGLSLALETLGDLRGALEGFQELADTPSLPPGVSRVAVLMLLCRTYLACGDLGRAGEVGEAALREHLQSGQPATDRTVELVATLVLCYYERGDLTRAEMLIDSAIRDAERLGSPRARASAYWNAALVAEGRGQVAEALHLTGRALAIYGELDNRRALAMLRRNQGWLLLQQDERQHGRARPLLAQALADLLEVGNPGEAAEAEADLARCELYAGHVEEALELARLATRRAADGPVIEAAKIRTVLAEALLRGGDTAAAVEVYRSVADELDRLGARRHAASVWHQLAAAYRATGDVAGAFDAYERAMAAGGLPVARRAGRDQAGRSVTGSAVATATHRAGAGADGAAGVGEGGRGGSH